VSGSSLSAGLRRQLEQRQGLLASGAQPLGWKAGFGAPDWLEMLGTSGPLVGFLTDATVVPSGGTVDISGWPRPVAEPELAVTLGDDLHPPIDHAKVRAAIASIGPAIELAAIDPPPQEVGEILEGNIFHRGLILGIADPARAGADLSGLVARIRPGGAEETWTDDLESSTGDVVGVITHLASLLAAHDMMMRSGEIVICGSIIPPIALTPGMTVEFELPPAPTISVSTAPL
jgi:2-keto-4-pentenoate hydratase